ncbi:MAG: hypothetical protein K8T25_07610, partial [Planctomycetia bacterium]|nr:hypothetical protein [Planctomycetia bacterium]
ALGSAIAARGLFHLEQHASRGVVLRRLLAAGLMIGAMALYRLDDQWPKVPLHPPLRRGLSLLPQEEKGLSPWGKLDRGVLAGSLSFPV